MLLYLQYHLWFNGGGIHDILRLRHALSDQTININLLKEQNEALLFQIKRLKESGNETESHARDELGMIKRDETFYRIVQ